MNELSRALGMKCRHKQAVHFYLFIFFSSPALSGISVYAAEDTQRRVLPPYVHAVHKCGITSVKTVLQECDTAQTRIWDKAGLSCMLALRERENDHYFFRK